MTTSGEIKCFLDWLNECVKQSESCNKDLIVCNNQIQDILHYIEINDCPYVERKKLTDLLPTIRKQRRVAKDTDALPSPISAWINKNSKAIKELQDTLGAVRKEEERQRNRAYMYRTDIVKDTIGHQ